MCTNPLKNSKDIDKIIDLINDGLKLLNKNHINE